MSDKIQLMQAAATLASGVISNLPDEDKLNADISDPNTRAENLMAWELFRIFYHGLVAAVKDEQSWPSPPVLASAPAGSVILDDVVKALNGSGLAADVVQKVLAGLGRSAPLPNPGA